MGVLKVRFPAGTWTPITGVGGGWLTVIEADARYVNVPGDTMTGQLTINRGPGQLDLAIVGDNSYVGWYSDDGNAQRGRTLGSPGGLHTYAVGQLGLHASGDVILYLNDTPLFRTIASSPPRTQSDVALHALAIHTWGSLPDTPGYGLTVDNGSIRTGDKVETTKVFSTDWTTAGFLNLSQGQGAAYVAHAPGIAPILGVANSLGERWRCLNNVNSGYCPIAASAFETNSTITSKRDVRSLRDRERVAVSYSVESDVVPPPDVMALRPVAFRPKVPAMRIAPTEGEYETVDHNDPTTWRSVPWDDDTVFGREGTRERLGLIAEEVQYVIPSAVTHDIDGNAVAIDYAQVTVALLDHVQRLTDEISTLRYRVAELEGTP